MFLNMNISQVNIFLIQSLPAEVFREYLKIKHIKFLVGGRPIFPIVLLIPIVLLTWTGAGRPGSAARMKSFRFLGVIGLCMKLLSLSKSIPAAWVLQHKDIEVYSVELKLEGSLQGRELW